MKRLLTAMTMVGAMFVGASLATAEEFPSKPIRVILGAGTGGMTDVSSRIIATRLEDVLGVPVVVENRPGGGGAIALSAALDEPADGYTIVEFQSGYPATFALTGNDMDLSQFKVLGSYMPQERVLFGHKSAPFSTFAEMVAYAKDNPVTFAHAGSLHSARVLEAFAKEVGMKEFRFVPFTSGAEASAAIMGGHVQLAETGVGTSAWHAARKEDASVRVLAVLSGGDLSDHGMPDIPNIQKFGAKYVVRQLYGLGVVAGVPDDRTRILSDAIRQVVEDPEVVAQFTKINLTPKWMGPAEYGPMITQVISEATALRQYIEASGQ